MAAIHYIYFGRGRFDNLSDLAKQIRLREVKLGIETVAVHIPAEANITPDALSRYFIATEHVDKHPHRTLRKRLLVKFNHAYHFTLGGVAADDGHDALLPD